MLYLKEDFLSGFQTTLISNISVLMVYRNNILSNLLCSFDLRGGVIGKSVMNVIIFILFSKSLYIQNPCLFVTFVVTRDYATVWINFRHALYLWFYVIQGQVICSYMYIYVILNWNIYYFTNVFLFFFNYTLF